MGFERVQKMSGNEEEERVEKVHREEGKTLDRKERGRKSRGKGGDTGIRRVEEKKRIIEERRKEKK